MESFFKKARWVGWLLSLTGAFPSIAVGGEYFPADWLGSLSPRAVASTPLPTQPKIEPAAGSWGEELWTPPVFASAFKPIAVPAAEAATPAKASPSPLGMTWFESPPALNLSAPLLSPPPSFTESPQSASAWSTEPASLFTFNPLALSGAALAVPESGVAPRAVAAWTAFPSTLPPMRLSVSAKNAWTAQATLADKWLERRLSRDAAPERVGPAEAEQGLILCGERIGASAGDPAATERRLARAWAYWKRARPEDGGLAAFEAWMTPRLPDNYPALRRRFVLLRLGADDPAEYEPTRAALLRLVDDPAAADFRDEILLMLATMDLRAEKPNAADFLRRLLKDHPQSPLAPRALFLSAWVELMDGQDAAASAHLKQLLANHPDDALTKRAREMLAGLEDGAPPPVAGADPDPRPAAPTPAAPEDGEVF